MLKNFLRKSISYCKNLLSSIWSFTWVLFFLISLGIFLWIQYNPITFRSTVAFHLIPFEQTSIKENKSLNLTKTPSEEFLENSTIKADSMHTQPPWIQYSQPYQSPEHTKQLALIIYNVGLKTQEAQHIIKNFPSTITLSFSPYTPHLKELLYEAYQAKHELLIDLPVEPSHIFIADQGEKMLSSQLFPEENLRNLRMLLHAAPYTLGVLIAHQSTLLSEEESLKKLLQYLNKKGLSLIDGALGSENKIRKISQEINIPFASMSWRIFPHSSPNLVEQSLLAIQEKFKYHDKMLILVPNTPMILKKLQHWISNLSKQKIALVPISYLIEKKNLQKQMHLENIKM